MESPKNKGDQPVSWTIVKADQKLLNSKLKIKELMSNKMVNKDIASSKTKDTSVRYDRDTLYRDSINDSFNEISNPYAMYNNWIENSAKERSKNNSIRYDRDTNYNIATDESIIEMNNPFSIYNDRTSKSKRATSVIDSIRYDRDSAYNSDDQITDMSNPISKVYLKDIQTKQKRSSLNTSVRYERDVYNTNKQMDKGNVSYTNPIFKKGSKKDNDINI